MNPKKIGRVNSLRSNLIKRAAFTLALTAITLPVAFAQNVKTRHLSGEKLRRVIEQTSKMRPAQMGKKTSSAGGKSGSNNATSLRIDLGNVTNVKWESIGPFGSLLLPFPAQSDFRLGAAESYVSGRAFGAAYDPNNDSIFYAAMAGGGLWRYNRADFSSPTYPWRPLGDQFPSLQTLCVAVSPFNPKVILVGTSGGVMRSINGGNTFVKVSDLELNSIVFDKNPFDPRTFVLPMNDPNKENPNKLYGTGPSGIFVSTDLGNAWNSAPATLLTSEPEPNSNPPRFRPVGEAWNDIEISLPRADDPADENDLDQNPRGFRYMYATNKRGGLYRSAVNGAGRGTVWERLNPPLVYNPVNLLYFDPYAGNYGIEVAVSASDYKTIFVMDSNGQFSDGKLFVSKDAGETWTEISGNYPVSEGISNNWTRSGYSTAMLATPTLLAGSIAGRPPIAVDAVLGGTFVNYSTEYTSVEGQTPIYPGRDWISAGVTHADQHDYAPNRLDPSDALVANDGGIYQLAYNMVSQSWSFQNNSLNLNLAATEFYGASFHPTQPIVLGGTINNGATQLQVPPAPGSPPAWSVIPRVASAFTPGEIARERAALAPPPAFITGGTLNEAFTPDTYIGSTAYDLSNPQIQYLMEHTTEGRGRIFVTRNNWASGWEITPDRIMLNASGVELRLNGSTLISVFNQVNGQDSGTGTNWAGETRKPEGILVPDIDNPNIVYTGGYYLWRYDLQPGFATVANAANIDRGSWRRVGTTQLATPETVNNIPEQDYITAVAVAEGGRRIYVGTHLGRLWMTRFGLQRDGATPTPSLTAPWISLNNATLPTRYDPPPSTPPGTQIRREITSISVNPRQPDSTSDILVGIAPMELNAQFPDNYGVRPGIYRCANTRGASFLFTGQNGINNGDTTVLLPTDAIVRTIVRDNITAGPDGFPGDQDNSWFVGTDVGVYSTINQGTIWTDATIPLGLPRLPIVSMDCNPNTGFLSIATQGRGAWRFELSAATEAIAPPVLSIKYALSRNAGTIYGNITVENSGGQAPNVRIVGINPTTNRPTITEEGATLRVGSRAEVSAATITPSTLGTIGNGPTSSRSFVVTWPAGTTGKTGEVVTLKISGIDGNGTTFTRSVRTRLP